MEQEYKGKKYIGFKVTSSENSNPDKERASGTFKGTEVSFKRTWGGHRFTDEEVTALLNGDKIEFITKNKQGHDCKVTGTLAKQKYKGFSYYGGTLRGYKYRKASGRKICRCLEKETGSVQKSIQRTQIYGC